MISQVYYRHNLLIRNRNGISTASWYRVCERARWTTLRRSVEIFLLPFKLIFYLQQIFAACLSFILYSVFWWPKLVAYFTFHLFVLISLCFSFVFVPRFVICYLVLFYFFLYFFWSLEFGLLAFLVVNQKISCWQRFVIFLTTNTRCVCVWLRVCVIICVLAVGPSIKMSVIDFWTGFQMSHEII